MSCFAIQQSKTQPVAFAADRDSLQPPQDASGFNYALENTILLPALLLMHIGPVY